MSTAQILFGRAAQYLTTIDEIVPVAAKHQYTFVSDEWFKEWLESDQFAVERSNYIIMFELLEKAHLASMTALMRARRWADAVCLMYDKRNFVGWAASFRGLLESAGDTVDGLINVPTTLARNYRQIARCLSKTEQEGVLAVDLENQLDHFVHAKWMRSRNNILKAKDNVDYIRKLEPVIPGVAALYHHLCSVCHPSSASIEYFYESSLPGFKLSPAKDIAAISAVCVEYPLALHDALMMHCNTPLLTLRVLHKFGIHPQLKALRKLDWKQIKKGPEIERLLWG